MKVFYIPNMKQAGRLRYKMQWHPGRIAGDPPAYAGIEPEADHGRRNDL